ncbi:Nudix hydrolase domain-containing protein [Flavobacterium longum]|uniref:NUDIX hydrolase n=1 Tax=Flavobacterium longum TaxID=1299340 RepID=UPI0039E99561
MQFSHFLQIVSKITQVALPGEAAHAKMSPPERLEKVKDIDFSVLNPKRAAVLMLVYPEDSQAVLTLIQRNSYKGVHSSQIAFPGGKIESFDASPLHTALRETEEEIGVHRDAVTIVSPFSELYIPPSNFKVSPFLGYLPEKPLFIPDPREVAAMVQMPLSVLLDDQFTELRRMATSYSQSIDVPVFNVGEHAVWGATAMMLSELKEVLKAVR